MGKPIVIVHGITDNDIYGKVGNRSQQLWWNSLSFAAKKVGSLRLAADGLTPAPAPGFPQVVSTSPATSIVNYSPLFNLAASLEEAGYDVRFFGYDWRLPIQVTAAQLHTFLNNSFYVSAEHFAVIAHSMGGLLARIAWNIAGANLRGLWDKTVYIGTPHGGSFLAIRALCDPLAMLEDQLGTYYMLYRVVRQNLIGNEAIAATRLLYQNIISTMPSVYEVMPNVVNGSAWPDPQCYGVISTPSLPTSADQFWSAARMNAAFATMGVLNGLVNQARDTDICIVGTGLPTEASFLAIDGAFEFDRYFFGDGDGVVTTERQKLPGTRIIEVGGLPHQTAPRDARIIRDMPTWIEGDDTFAASVPQLEYFDPNLQLQGAAPPAIQSTWNPPNLALPIRQDP